MKIFLLMLDIFAVILAILVIAALLDINEEEKRFGCRVEEEEPTWRNW